MSIHHVYDDKGASLVPMNIHNVLLYYEEICKTKADLVPIIWWSFPVIFSE